MLFIARLMSAPFIICIFTVPVKNILLLFGCNPMHTFLGIGLPEPNGTCFCIDMPMDTFAAVTLCQTRCFIAVRVTLIICVLLALSLSFDDEARCKILK